MPFVRGRRNCFLNQFFFIKITNQSFFINVIVCIKVENGKHYNNNIVFLRFNL